MIHDQIFHMVNLGIAILDKDLTVKDWNRWLELHTKIPADAIINTPLLDHFPNLNEKWFLRNCRAVLQFGNFAFFSQKLHHYTLPIKPVHHLDPAFEYMQQNCTLGPLRNEANEVEYIYMIIQDATEVAAYEKKLLEMSVRDSLTEIYNRRYFEAKLKEEVDRHQRYGCALSLIMIDIDLFKQINDTHGHQAGDQVLMQVAMLFTDRLRSVDTVARYGGEEFCLLLPETEKEAAALVAEDLRKIVENHTFSYGDVNIDVTVSLGVIDVCGKDIRLHDVLKQVDDALYSAKENGRNTVVTM